MQFVSTRGQAPAVSFSDAILNGLAPDGGLYMPEIWPQITPDEIERFATEPYRAIAWSVLKRFVDDDCPRDAALAELLTDAYQTFRHESVAPLVELRGDVYVLELFHGPTLSFKDVAMQFLARLMDHILRVRHRRATIVAATSGDTGSAAIEAFRGRNNIDVFILHPKGRTSEVQRRQMTTVLDPNVHNIAIEGTFDDCQAIVKGLFGNPGFRDQVGLSAVNSINFGRIAAQIGYYFKAAAQLGAPHRKVAFSVPTGNFGDIFAGYAAKRMGLPLGRLLIASNENDILPRTLRTGEHETHAVVETTSPSMDIQVSSNFERLLFEAGDRSGEDTRALMQRFAQSSSTTLPAGVIKAIRRDFSAGSVDRDEVRATIADIFNRTGYTLDPHSAIGVAVALRHAIGETPMVSLATAHPAKFPDAVRAATGIEPALPLWLADLNDREERYDVLPNDQAAVEAYVRAHTRAEEFP